MRHRPKKTKEEIRRERQDTFSLSAHGEDAGIARNHDLNVNAGFRQDKAYKPDPSRLRGFAEAIARQMPVRTEEHMDKSDTEDPKRLLHELQVHQIELEMQNDELRQVQTQLEISHDRYENLYEFAPVGYFTIDAEGLIRDVNLTGTKMLGIGRSSLVNKPFSAFVNCDYTHAFQQHCADVLKSQEQHTVELRLNHKDRTEFYALLESIAVQNPEGNTAAIRTAVSDITVRRKTEAAFQESERRYSLLVANMLDGYAYCRLLYDSHGRPEDFVYLAVNNAFEYLTGLKSVVGRKATDVILGIRELHPELLETYGRVAATGKTEKFEIELKPLGMWLSIAAYSTERDHFTTVFDNITSRRQAVDNLQESNRDLARFNTAAVGRELRMIELKKEINELCVQAGHQPRYPLDFDEEQQ